VVYRNRILRGSKFYSGTKLPRQAIFLSYRRSDSVYAVDQLAETAHAGLGEGAVFRDATRGGLSNAAGACR